MPDHSDNKREKEKGAPKPLSLSNGNGSVSPDSSPSSSQEDLLLQGGTDERKDKILVKRGDGVTMEIEGPGIIKRGGGVEVIIEKFLFFSSRGDKTGSLEIHQHRLAPEEKSHSTLGNQPRS